MNDLTFEQAALLSRWLSGDRDGLQWTELLPNLNPFKPGQMGRRVWVFIERKGQVKEEIRIWIPAEPERPSGPDE